MPRRISEADTETIVARVLADPYTQAVNLDGGHAAAEFIREAAAGLHNPPIDSPEWERKQATARARWQRLLDQIGGQ